MIIKDGKNYTNGQKTISILNERNIEDFLTQEEIEQATITEFKRLIAEEGFILTNGVFDCPVIDVKNIEGWTEKIEEIVEEEIEELI